MSSSSSMEIDGLSFIEAVERIADKDGVELQARGGRRLEDRRKDPPGAS